MLISFLAVLMVALMAPPSFADPWNAQNDPAIFGKYEYSFASLPRKGRTAVSVQPWSDTYWPSYMSGIAHRWNSDNAQDFEYHLNSLAELKKMTPSQLATLSPAEKLDIFAGRYDYPTVNSEWQRTSPQNAKWEGLCHGWAPAAQFYQQPEPVNLTNPDGIVVPFGSSDVKALLTYFVAIYDEAFTTTTYLANRCNYDLSQQPWLANRSACSDMNAGTFHVLIANQMAMPDGGFIVDRDRSIAVWNQPVFYWNTTCTKSSATSVNCLSLMVYGKETQPMWDAHDTYPVGEWYKYTLDLDRDGNIKGGSYADESPVSDRVDFAWNVVISAFPAGYFQNVASIYQSSVNNTTRKRQTQKVGRALALPSQRPGHSTLSVLKGSFGVPAYTEGQRKSWTLPESAGGLWLKCTVDTERQFDLVRVYERHADGSLGPLLRVLHGRMENVELVFRTPVYVSFFASPNTRGGAGFNCDYGAI